MTKTKRHLSSCWVDTKSAAIALGISTRHLTNLRVDGLLKHGDDWRDIRRLNAMRATYRWHLERCQKKLNILPEKRR